VRNGAEGGGEENSFEEAQVACRKREVRKKRMSWKRGPFFGGLEGLHDTSIVREGGIPMNQFLVKTTN